MQEQGQSGKPVTIALLTDLHFGTKSSIPKRRAELGEILLKRAVMRLNRLVRPDVTLVLGDLLDDGTAADAPTRLAALKKVLDELKSPYLVIPGNHDGDVAAFYRVFPQPPPIADLGGVRFLSFVDAEEPGYNARRSEADIARFAAARQNYRGPIVALQHTCLFPPAHAVAPYNYTNAPAIIAAMEAAGVCLSVSGHFHAGAPHTRAGEVLFVNAPALCETPFPFLVVTLADGRAQPVRHELAMPPHLQLFDGHLHTQLAYCSENMDVTTAIDLAATFGLAGLAFTEHSGQLYFERQRYWDNTCLREGLAAARPEHWRLPDYLALKRSHEQRTIRFGLEVDCDYHGQLLLSAADRGHFDYLVGAIHGLPDLRRESPPTATDHATFLHLVECMLQQGVAVVAHPFRVFRRAGWPPPPELFRPLAELLRRYQVAAEINFHTNEPPVDFFRICLEHGVKISFASDAHHLAEVGDFACHLALLRDAGYDGDLADILLPRRLG